jgi:hypothetical protein
VGKRFTIFVLLFVLPFCAWLIRTAQVDNDLRNGHYRFLGSSAILAQSTTPASEKSQIIIFREHKSLWGRAIKPGVEVDGFPLGALSQARYFTVTVTPGKHIVRGDSVSTLRTSTIIPLGIDLAPGETIYVRLYALRTGIAGAPQLRLQTVQAEKARSWIKGCKPAEDNVNVDLAGKRETE